VARPLADGPRWREVRGIAAAARHTGACWGLPGPLRPSVVKIAPGGRAATSSDQDGTIWFHDLDRRTSRELIRLGVAHGHAVFAGDDRLVVYSTQRLAVIELATGAIHDVPHGVEIRTAAATRTAVFVVAEAGQVHRFELDGSGSVRLDVERAHGVELSPDGRRLAAETAAGVVLFDLAGGAPPVRIGDRYVIDVQWDPSSSAFSVHFMDHELALVALEPAPAVGADAPARGGAIVARRPSTRHGGAHVALHGGLITHAEHGLEGAGSGPLVAAAGTRDFPLAVARGDTLVIGRHGGTIMLLHDHVGVELRAPSDRLERLATSPASPYVVAAAQGRLLVWNLDDILPRVRRIERAHEHYAVSPRRLLLGTAAGGWRWHDLDTGAEAPVQIPAQPFLPVFDGREDLVALTYDGRVTVGAVPGFVVVKYGQPIIEVETEASALQVADGRITVGTPEGEVLDFDPVRLETRPLTARPGRAVTAVGGNGRWRAARWSDGTLWRRGPDGREELTTSFAGPAPFPLLFQQASGRVCIGVGARLECWNPDGSSTSVATFPADVAAIQLMGNEAAIVALADRGLYRVDLLKPGEPTSLGPSGGMSPILAGGPGMAVALGADNKVSVVDLVVNASWPLINGVRGANLGVRITPDGDTVSVLASNEYLLTWRLGLPQGPAATARWLDELTNATSEHGTAKLSWR
jgi:hypothetical protein